MFIGSFAEWEATTYTFTGPGLFAYSLGCMVAHKVTWWMLDRLFALLVIAKDFMLTPRHPTPMPPIPKKKRSPKGGYQPDGRNTLDLADPPKGGPGVTKPSEMEPESKGYLVCCEGDGSSLWDALFPRRHKGGK